MKRTKIIIVLVITLIILFAILIGIRACSSLLPGDGVLLVSGEVVDSHDNPINNCMFELYYADSNRLIGSDQISSDFKVRGEFQLHYVIAPRPYKYYMIVRCPDFASEFKSDVYKISGRNYSRNPLDLGKIVMER